jgi:hypothetical protein
MNAPEPMTDLDAAVEEQPASKQPSRPRPIIDGSFMLSLPNEKS